jgi:FdhD protein
MSTLLSSKGLQVPQVSEASSTVLAFDSSRPVAATRAVPVEVPVNFTYGGISFAVMMATPTDLDDFAIGFSLTEGVIQRPEDIRSVRLETEAEGLRLAIDLIPERLHEHLARRRVLSGRTGCGLCGIDDLKALPRAPRSSGKAPHVALTSIHRALATLEM